MDEIVRKALGVAETDYIPAQIETVRIVNVNIADWSVDCVADEANKRFFDIQVMSPYFHFANGEGWYCVPEVGCLAWICRPSVGQMAAPFILGFQSPFDETQQSFQAHRQSLNPGDMMWRTRDENFIILRRGGVVQIGATPICQTILVPIKNLMRHFCENWELNTFGGEMLWKVDRDDQTTDGNAPTTLTFNVKSKANDPGYTAHLTVGSHGDGEPTTMELTINESGEKDAKVKINCKFTNEGDVLWDVEQDFTVVAKRSISMATEDDSISFDSGKDFAAQAKGNMNLEAEGDWKGASGGTTELIGGTKTVVDAPAIELGAGAVSQVIKGTELVQWLTALCSTIAAFTCAAPTSPVVGATAVGPMAAQLSSLLSTVVKTK
jgi:hypothetical protein